LQVVVVQVVMVEEEVELEVIERVLVLMILLQVHH
jgi:hypothetical protein